MGSGTELVVKKTSGEFMEDPRNTPLVPVMVDWSVRVREIALRSVPHGTTKERGVGPVSVEKPLGDQSWHDFQKS